MLHISFVTQKLPQQSRLQSHLIQYPKNHYMMFFLDVSKFYILMHLTNFPMPHIRLMDKNSFHFRQQVYEA